MTPASPCPSPSPQPWPQRIVCLSAETPEILFRIGAGQRVVGVSGYTTSPPEARRLPKVSAFATADLARVLALQPDLVVTSSDVQADLAAGLVRAGVTVLALNARSLADIAQAILLLGGVTGQLPQAEALVRAFLDEVEALRRQAATLPRRPRVYFEEWPEPMITGIQWVGELIEAAGGVDLFADRRSPAARDRVVTAEEVAARQPDLIVASWCGRRVRFDEIRRRPGWDQLPAFRHGRVYELPSQDILQPGPQVLQGARRLAAWIAEAANT